MYKVGEYVVFKRDVCKVSKIKEDYLQGKDYYLLNPILDESLKIEIPIDCIGLRDLISKDDINTIIKKIPDIEIISANIRQIDNEYKALMNSGRHEDLIKVIKTSYLRNKEKTDNNKRIGDKENNFLKQAEKYFYSELSIVLGLNYDETKEYVKNEVEKLNE